MKLQKAFRVPVMVVGLGAALLLAGPVRAQQEIDPDTFDVNPGTPKAEEVRASSLAMAAPLEGAVVQESVTPAALWTSASATLEQVLVPPSGLDMMLAIVLMAGVGFVAIYVVKATRRARGVRPSFRRRAYPSAFGATTH